MVRSVWQLPVVSTEARRAEWRDLLSTISRLSLKEGLSTPRFALRSRRRGSAICEPGPQGGEELEGRRDRIMLRRSLLAAPLVIAAAPAWAQWVPRQPIKILVGYAPGGTADIAARIAAETIQRQHGYTVIVDDKTGAGG